MANRFKKSGRFSALSDQSVDPFADVKSNAYGNESNGFIETKPSDRSGKSPTGEAVSKNNWSRGEGWETKTYKKSSTFSRRTDTRSEVDRVVDRVKARHKQQSMHLHKYLLGDFSALTCDADGKLDHYNKFLQKLAGNNEVILNELYAVGIECIMKNSLEHPELVDLLEQVYDAKLTSRSDASSKWSPYNIFMWFKSMSSADYDTVGQRIIQILHNHGCDIFQGNYKEDVDNQNKKETPLASLEVAGRSEKLELRPEDIRRRRELFLTGITNQQLRVVVRQLNKLGIGTSNPELFAQLRFAFTYRPTYTIPQAVIDTIMSIGEGKLPVATHSSPVKARIETICDIINSCKQSTPTTITYLSSYFASARTLPIDEYNILLRDAILNYTYVQTTALNTSSPDDLEHERNRERSMLDAQAYTLGVAAKIHPTLITDAMKTFVVQTLSNLPEDDDTKTHYLVSRAIRCIFAAEAFTIPEIITAINAIRPRVDKMRVKTPTLMLIEEFDRKVNPNNKSAPLSPVFPVPTIEPKLTLIESLSLDPEESAEALGDAIEYYKRQGVSTTTIAAKFFEQLATVKMPKKTDLPENTIIKLVEVAIQKLPTLDAFNQQLARQNDEEDTEYQLEYPHCVAIMSIADEVLKTYGVL